MTRVSDLYHEESYAELDSESVEDYQESTDDRPVSSQPRDWTISALRDKYDRGQIELQPHYQREYVWELKPELPSRLIESILLEIPIPPIYFGHLRGQSRLEVIDGQQRLTTLIRFINNDFPLQRLQRMGSLNGKRFRDLSETYQEKILDTPIRSIVIDAGNNQDLRYEVFERLNRGSMALNEQELRNCVYRGPFSDLLAELEQDPNWRRVRGTPQPEPRFREREMILRFFAFANRLNHYRGNLKRFLNDYMSSYAPHDPEKLDELRKMFKQTMQNVAIVFGPSAGRIYSAGTEDNPTVDGKWEKKFSISALDIQASALMGYPPSKVQAAAEQIKEAYIYFLLTNPHIRLAISRQPAGKEATLLRWTGFRSEVQNLLTTFETNPQFFSYDIRRGLFEADPTCTLCRNPIHSFEDATALPVNPNNPRKWGNARLTHRVCAAHQKMDSLDIPESPYEALRQAELLINVGYIMAAGSTVGVVLESHLKKLAKKIGLPESLSEKGTISKLNDALRNQGEYDQAKWRQVQWLGDIRNKCDHAGSAPPLKEDVVDMIRKTKDLLSQHPV